MAERRERVPVDLDRLADHAAGVLDGTPQAAEVEHLVATDPAWAAAAASLRAADERVRADLAALPAPGLPTGFAARIDAALAAAEPPAPAAADRGGHAAVPPGLAATEGPSEPVAADPSAADPSVGVAAGPSGSSRRAAAGDRAAAHGRHARPGRASHQPGNRDSGPADGRPAARPRRRRTLAWAGAAALVFAIAAGTVTAANLGNQRGTTSASTAQGRATDSGGKVPADGPEVATAPRGVPAVTRSNTDYGPATLAQAAARRAAADAKGPSDLPIPLSRGGLARLADPAALAACTAALTARYGGTVRSVEFARFRGSPAVIVVLDGPPVRVVAAGPGCGQVGTDEIYTTTG